MQRYYIKNEKENMAKIIALDLGDVWTGIAISDALKTLARPLKSVKTNTLFHELGLLFKQEQIEFVVVGYPLTLSGRESKQTEQIKKQKEMLEKKFPDTQFVFWDERLSSKQAEQLQREMQKKSTESTKQQGHAVAAALVLDTFLLHKQFSLKTFEND